MTIIYSDGHYSIHADDIPAEDVVYTLEAIMAELKQDAAYGRALLTDYETTA